MGCMANHRDYVNQCFTLLTILSHSAGRGGEFLRRLANYHLNQKITHLPTPSFPSSNPHMPSAHTTIPPTTHPLQAEEEFLQRLANYQDHLNQGPRVDKLWQHLRKAASMRVEESMTDTVLQVEEDSFMVDATEIMLNCNVSRLPVVVRLPDGRRTLTGIITCSDILRHTLLLL
ncbi:unnamed protein product [Closterium sp. Yama58-4]|nr:unnamed protein product [Closterium sp. Yama58-4]